MTEKKEGPILAMAAVTLVLIVVMAGVSIMSLYTALYPPDFEQRAEELERERQEQASQSTQPLENGEADSADGTEPEGDSTGSNATENQDS